MIFIVKGFQKALRILAGLLIFLSGLCAATYVTAVQARAQDFGVGYDLNIGDMVAGLRSQYFQVRVEQRVIIRVPAQRVSAASISVGAPSRSAPIKFHEKKIAKCLMMDRLVASRPGPKESLELVTRDGALVRAYLGKGCLAREFYAGAYMERPDDGRLCVDRDLLYARTGAKCEIDKFRLLVPE